MSATVAAEFYEYLGTANVDAAFACLHESVIWHQPGAVDISGDHVGKAKVIALIQAFARMGIGVALTGAYRYNEAMLCRVRVQHRLGKRDEFQVIGMTNGQISEIRHFGDTDFLCAISESTKPRSGSGDIGGAR